MDKFRRQAGSAGLYAAAALCVLVAACAKETPPPSVRQFLEDPILMEATMLRCAENRSESKYATECVNAREAANRIDVDKTEARRQDMEAQSERKRQALRNAQEAAARARERTAEAERMRREAELLGHFETPAATADDTTDGANMPVAMPTPPADSPAPQSAPPPADSEPGTTPEDSLDTAQPPVEGDLNAVREELRRRQQDNDDDE